MATKVAKNPRLVMATLPMSKRLMRAADTQTWKAGQWANNSASGLVVVCATDDDEATGGGIKYVLLEDQDTSTSSSDVWVGDITSGMVFEINELDGAVTNSSIGDSFAINVTSNIVTFDVSDTTDEAVVLMRIAADYEPEKNASGDTLALCHVRVRQDVMDAANA